MRKPSLLLLALLSFGAQAEVWQARYGVAETFNFKLYNADGTLDVDEADGGTEVSVSCNEGAETTTTNDFVDEGTFYSIALTSGEMSCERIAVIVAATTTEVFFIQTIDNTSAMTPMIVQTGDSFARLGAPAGASVSADIVVLDNFVDDLESRVGTPSNLGGGATVAGNLSDIEGQTDDIGAAGAGLTILSTQASVNTIDDFLDTEVTAILAAVDTEVTAIKTKTDFLPSATAGSAGGVFIAGTNAATTITTALTTTFTGNVTGNVGGNVTGSVGTVNALAANSVTAAAAATDFTTEVQNGLATAAAIAALNNLSAAQLRDLAIEDQGSGVSLGCALSVILAGVMGDLSTTGGTSTFEEPSGTETRAVSIVVSNGNRTTTITCPTY